MDKILNILNEKDGNFDVKIEKKDKLKTKKVKSLKVGPLFDDDDDYTPPPHPNLLRPPYSLLMVAPKGSGKTTLLQNIIVWYFSMFDNVFIFSPTINLDRKWKDLIEALRIPEENLFSSYKEAEVSNIINQIKDFNSSRENKDKCKCLLIFDDIIESLPKGKKKTALNKLAFNHRHYYISHIIISQSYKKIDPVVRSNTTGLILFNVDNQAEREKIFTELCGKMGKNRFEELFNEATKEKYGFLYLNYDNRLCYKNLDKVLCHLDNL